jgi:uroporphyrinogen decarboxylase
MEFEAMKKRGVTTLYGCMSEAAFDSFSLARGLIPFVRDCRARPDEVAAAADALTESYYFVTRVITMLMGVPRAEIFVHRSSTDFISPKMFGELSFPSLKRLADKLVAAGISPVFHLDGNWDENLETLRELPAGNCVVQFDGPTDIFLAKQIIGDRICMMGDVPSTMLALGSPAEVDEYCHRLIEEVGRGGGYIMGAGCEIPPNAKPENVKAMIESVSRYGYYI